MRLERARRAGIDGSTISAFERVVTEIAVDYLPMLEALEGNWRMNVPPVIDLTTQQQSVPLGVLAQFCPPVERVDVHGSRASGTARSRPDVDLVLAGTIDGTTRSRIRGAVEQRYLSIFADVASYDLIEADGFRDPVLSTAQTLFTHNDLLAARATASRAA